MRRIDVTVVPKNGSDRSERAEMIAKLSEQRNELVDRLDTGAEKIEAARSQGRNVGEWEDYWITLLRQYEEVCSRIRDIAGPQG